MSRNTERENLATRINDSPVGKFCLPMGLGIVTGNFIDTTSVVQQIFNRHFYGILGGGAGWAIAESEIKFGDFEGVPFPFKRGVGALLARGLGLSVVLQTIDLISKGRLDLEMQAPLLVGAVAGKAIHEGAKALYDSGLTMPIYRKLGIQDRRLPVNQLPR